ncbi:MAG: zinc ribbon domain-containing protein [Halobacteriales archaeon]|nr:zinc ribbon domain-containing protein [Halobacteriales archaeon]
MSRGIDAAGVYVPRARLPTDEQRAVWDSVRAPGIEAVAIPGADEDALTMAVAAAERALAAWDGEPGTIETAGLATTTPPSAEGALAGRLAAALGLAEGVATADLGGDLLAGAAALDRALDADGPALIAVADAPPGDPGAEGQRAGAGAAAFVVDDDAAVPMVGWAWHSAEYPGVRFRATDGELSGLGVRTYERAAARESVSAALDRIDGEPAEVAAAALHQPHAGAPHRLGAALGLDDGVVAAGVVADRIGDAGAAGVPVGLCAALDGRAADDRTLAGFAGSEGGAAAFVLEGGIDVGGIADLDDGVEVDYPAAMRLRGELGDAAVAGGGAYVSLPTWRRTLAQRYRLEAGRCPECDAVAFPPEGACPDCGERVDHEAVSLAPEGTLVALTVIGEGAAPPEFAELQRRSGPFATGIVECPAEGGGAARLPAMLTDCDPADVAVGDPVRATFRRLYEQEGVARYGRKFVPDRG